MTAPLRGLVDESLGVKLWFADRDEAPAPSALSAGECFTLSVDICTGDDLEVLLDLMGEGFLPRGACPGDAIPLSLEDFTDEKGAVSVSRGLLTSEVTFASMRLVDGQFFVRPAGRLLLAEFTLGFRPFFRTPKNWVDIF